MRKNHDQPEAAGRLIHVQPVRKALGVTAMLSNAYGISPRWHGNHTPLCFIFSFIYIYSAHAELAV